MKLLNNSHFERPIWGPLVACAGPGFMLDVTPRMPTNSKIYLDHNATTSLLPETKVAIPTFLEEFGNPSSIHWAGRAPKAALRETRASLAKLLEINPLEIIFTSGGSESNNTVIQSVFSLSRRTEYITTEVEHPSVLKTFKWIESKGAVVHYLKVNRQGQIDLDHYKRVISEKVALVSVMLANNETGVIFPIQAMAQIAHAQGALFHSDCVQALGKIPLNLKNLGVDYASFSAHKVNALKGCGFLFVKRNSPFQPLLHGGAQERSRRGGTENTLGIFSLGLSCQKILKTPEVFENLRSLRDSMEKQLLEITGVQVTSGEALRLPNTSSLTIQGVDGETLLMSLDLKGFAVSTGAACSSGSPEPSPVLLAIGLSRQEAQSSLRVSLGRETTADEIKQFVQVLKEIISRLRSMTAAMEESNVCSL